MRKALLISLIVSSLVNASAQTNMYWFNPFNFYPVLQQFNGVNEAFVMDTSGQFWFYTYDSTLTEFHIVNQNSTIEYSMNLGAYNYAINCYFDCQNRLLVNRDNFWGQYIVDTLIQIDIPHLANAYSLGVAISNDGNDYFLTEYPVSSGIDSFYIVEYNGSTFQSTYLNSLGIPFNDSTVSARFAVCDNSGALYVDCNTYGLMKYYQGNWSHLPMTINAADIFLGFDKNNNMYFLVEDSNVFLIQEHGTTLDTIAAPAAVPDIVYWGDIGMSFTFGPDSNLWFLTNGYGFYDLQSNNTWTYLPAPGFISQYDDVGDADLFPATFDRQGRMWTTGGDDPPPLTIGVYSFTPFDAISGRVFYDNNGNGVPDSTDAGFTAMNIVQSTNGFYTNTDTSGDYAVIYLDSTITHMVTANPPQYYHLTTPASYSVNPGDSLCCYNFGVKGNGNIQDLQITAASLFLGRNYPWITWLNYQNTGTVTVSDTITYVFDSLLTYYLASPLPTFISGNTLSWTYENLQPFDMNTITIGFFIDTAAQFGDTLISVATIQPVATDTTPANNVYVNIQVVPGPFDPNLKTVSPASNARPGQELTYTIYFQNTGTSAAVNIVLLDTLDVNLNPATFRLLGSSSPVKVSLQGPGIISFAFNNINLPDSGTSATLSCGFVQFAVSIANPLNSPAESVANTAYVTFDFNSPIQTNSVMSSFSSTVGVLSPTSARADLTLKLLPNPAGDEVLVVTDENIPGGTLNVYNAIGEKITSKRTNGENTNLDLHQFAAGIYLVQVISERGKIGSGKLIKQ